MSPKVEAEVLQHATIAKRLVTCPKTVPTRSNSLMEEVVGEATLREAEEGNLMGGMETKKREKSRNMMNLLGETRQTKKRDRVFPLKLGVKNLTKRPKTTSKVSSLTFNCCKEADGARKLLRRMTLAETLGIMMELEMTHLPDLRGPSKKVEAMAEVEAEEEEAPVVVVVDQAEPVTNATRKAIWQESALIKQTRDHLDKVAVVEVGEPATNVTKRVTLQGSALTQETAKVAEEEEAEAEEEGTSTKEVPDHALSASRKDIWLENALMTLETADLSRDREGMMEVAPTEERMTTMEEEANGMEETTNNGTTLQLPQDSGTTSRVETLTGSKQLNRTMTLSRRKEDGATEMYRN